MPPTYCFSTFGYTTANSRSPLSLAGPPLPHTAQLSACCWPCSSPEVAPAAPLLSCQVLMLTSAPRYGPRFTPSLLQVLLGSPSPSCPSSRWISAWGVSFGPSLHHQTSHQMFPLALTLSISSQWRPQRDPLPNHSSSDEGVQPPRGAHPQRCTEPVASIPSIAEPQNG